jgi:hypothetical protein
VNARSCAFLQSKIFKKQKGQILPEKKLIQIQQIPDESNDCQPLMLTYCTDPVLESFPVQCNDLEDERYTLNIKAIVRVRRNGEGMREPNRCSCCWSAGRQG